MAGLIITEYFKSIFIAIFVILNPQYDNEYQLNLSKSDLKNYLLIDILYDECSEHRKN